MKHIRQKLNNRDGVSILIALVGFLAAAMIAAVIVSAALTSAKRVADDKTENQAHLTLESAAQVVQEGIEGTVYSCDTNTATGAFKYEMEGGNGAVQMVDKNSSDDSDSEYKYKSSSYDRDFTVTLSGNNSAVKTVNGSFIMKNGDEKYDMTITLSIAGAAEEMYISVDGFRREDNTITWTVVSINGLGADDTDE